MKLSFQIIWTFISILIFSASLVFAQVASANVLLEEVALAEEDEGYQSELREEIAKALHFEGLSLVGESASPRKFGLGTNLWDRRSEDGSIRVGSEGFRFRKFPVVLLQDCEELSQEECLDHVLVLYMVEIDEASSQEKIAQEIAEDLNEKEYGGEPYKAVQSYMLSLAMKPGKRVSLQETYTDFDMEDNVISPVKSAMVAWIMSEVRKGIERNDMKALGSKRFGKFLLVLMDPFGSLSEAIRKSSAKLRNFDIRPSFNLTPEFLSEGLDRFGSGASYGNDYQGLFGFRISF